MEGDGRDRECDEKRQRRGRQARIERREVVKAAVSRRSKPTLSLSPGEGLETHGDEPKSVGQSLSRSWQSRLLPLRVHPIKH